jgi:Zn-dependent protease/CBS domain-containing protein
MFANALPLGSIHGIKIRIHWTWVIIFVLVTWSLAAGYFPSMFPSWSVTEDWVVAVLAALLLFVSVLLHELSHSFVAQAEGLPVSSITLFIFGGVSNLTREPPTVGEEFRMAAAGPAMSILIGIVCLALNRVLPGPSWLVATFGYLGLINLLLAAFNLIPAFPLDGGRVLHSIIWATTHNSVQATGTASVVGEGFGWLFILGGLFLLFTGNVVNGIWFALIGWFLQNAASAYRHAPTTSALQTLAVGDVMTRNLEPIPPDVRLDDAVHDYLLRQGQRALPVATGTQLLGILSMTDVHHFSQEQWPAIAVGRAMIPVERVESVPPTMLVTDALRLMTTHGRHELPVLDDGRLVGLLTQSGVMTYFQLRRELGISMPRPQREVAGPRSA